jgi:hypothetical protein
MLDEYKRLKRMFKSLIPRFPRDEDRQYTLSDARNMINDLGIQMSPEALERLVSSDLILDDFINNIYFLEEDIGRKVITEFATIDMKYNPRVYEDQAENLIGFSVTYRGEEIVFAEYPLREES